MNLPLGAKLRKTFFPLSLSIEFGIHLADFPEKGILFLCFLFAGNGSFESSFVAIEGNDSFFRFSKRFLSHSFRGVFRGVFQLGLIPRSVRGRKG